MVNVFYDDGGRRLKLYIKGDYTKEIPFDYLESSEECGSKAIKEKVVYLSPILVSSNQRWEYIAIHLKTK